jgi:hypothetical protein
MRIKKIQNKLFDVHGQGRPCNADCLAKMWVGNISFEGDCVLLETWNCSTVCWW